MNASRTVGALDFGESLSQEFGRGIAIMPLDPVFHEADALALHRVRNQHGGLAGRPGASVERVRERVMIVSVDLLDRPAERIELGVQGLQSKRLLDAREALQLVVVDNAKEVVELVMGREQRGLPVAALVPFAVTCEDDGPPVLRLALGRERLSGSEWQ